MPKIVSTITRAQSEAAAIPRLPKSIDDMTPEELHGHLATVRVDRMAASEKRKTTRATNKKKKADKAESVDEMVQEADEGMGGVDNGGESEAR